MLAPIDKVAAILLCLLIMRIIFQDFQIMLMWGAKIPHRHRANQGLILQVKMGLIFGRQLSLKFWEY